MWSAVMDVGEWLKGINLGQYEATFREHEIDADVLADLSEADLRDIGLPLGARKRLLKAIANLASNEASPAPRAPGVPPQPSARPAAPRGSRAAPRQCCPVPKSRHTPRSGGPEERLGASHGGALSFYVAGGGTAVVHARFDRGNHVV
jgi:hypothetical protein